MALEKLSALSSLMTAAHRRLFGPGHNLINLMSKAQRRLGSSPAPELIEALSLTAKVAFQTGGLANLGSSERFLTDLIRAGKRVQAESLTSSDLPRIVEILQEELNYPARVDAARTEYLEVSRNAGLDPVRRAYILRNIRPMSIGGKPVAQMTPDEFIAVLMEKEASTKAACEKILAAKEDRTPLKLA